MNYWNAKSVARLSMNAIACIYTSKKFTKELNTGARYAKRTFVMLEVLKDMKSISMVSSMNTRVVQIRVL